MSFQQGLSGLNAASRNLEIIGNNVANANTVGFKQSRGEFSDVYANSVATASNSSVGIGTTLAAVTQQFGQGNISTTNNPLDLAVNGQGFFRLSNNGSVTYTRNGEFHLDQNGYIVTSSGANVTGFLANAAGQIATGTPGLLRLQSADLPPKTTAIATAVMNLDSRVANLTAAGFDPTDPTTYQGATSMSVFDSLGNSHTLSLYFVKTASNVWSAFGTADGVAIGAGALGQITFNSSGAISSPPTTLPFNVSIPLTNGATTPLTMTMDFTGSTQFGSPITVNQITQDGFTSGKITGYNVSGDGTIVARYSNGQVLAQGQISLANFQNPQGLVPLGGSQWAESTDSGTPLLGAPKTGSLGALQGGAVEESNVDLTAELVNMITAQRVYQANAQTIKTQDAVLQTLVNLR